MMAVHSHVCGHLLENGGHCQQRVHEPDQQYCHWHATGYNSPPPERQLPADQNGCVFVMTSLGHWKCQTHQNDNWGIAEAMGAQMPCQLRLGTPTLHALAAAPTLDHDTAQLLAYGDWSVVAVLLRNPACPPDVKMDVYRRAVDVQEQQQYRTSTYYREIMEAAAKDPNTPPSVLDRLVHDGAWNVFVAARDNPSAPEGALRRVVANQEANFEAVGALPWCPPDILQQMAHSDSPTARAAVARNPGCPTEYLEGFLRDPDWIVRASAYGNPLLSEQRLAELAKEYPQYRAEMARNPNCPPGVLRQLSRDRSPQVRGAVARHQRSPWGVRLRLRFDRNGSVRAARST